MPSGIDHGYGSPFVRLFYGTLELSSMAPDFSYVADEEGDDVIEINIETDDRSAPDRPEWQEKAELRVIWGYIQGEESEQRKIYIQDIKWTYKKESISAKIQATEKSSINEVH